VDAGDVRQMKATELSVAARNSARMPGSAALLAKYAKNRGLCQCVVPGSRISSRSRRTSANGSPRSGGDAGRRLRISPGST
jgi:hypothetical protein